MTARQDINVRRRYSQLPLSVHAGWFHDKLNRLADQALLAKLAEIYTVPTLGESVPARSIHEIISANRAHGGVQSGGGSDGRGYSSIRRPPTAKGRVAFNWDYSWDSCGRLVSMQGTLINKDGSLHPAGAAREYRFSYNMRGKFVAARLTTYKMDGDRRVQTGERVIHARMSRSALAYPNELSIAAFYSGNGQPGSSAVHFALQANEDLTRFAACEEVERLIPRERLAELAVTLPVIEALLREQGPFSGISGTILKAEVERQLLCGRAEWALISQEALNDRFAYGCVLNAAFSSKTGDILCDPALCAAEKKGRLLELGKALARASTAARGHSIQDECKAELRAVRIAWDLLKEVG